MKTKFAIFGLIILILSSMVGAASAQEETSTTQSARMRSGVLQTLVDVLTEETGLTAQEIFQQVRDGATLAEVIEANGGSVEDVTQALITEAETRVEEAVSNGQMTQERADEILANLETRITEALNSQFELGGRGERLRERFENSLRNDALNIISEATGLDLREIRQALVDGATLAEVIESNGGDVNAISADLVTQATVRVNQLVADGTITQERADEFLAQLETRVDDFLNRTWELRERSAQDVRNS